MLLFRDIDEDGIGVEKLVLPLAAGCDQRDVAFAPAGLSDNSFVHCRIGFAKGGQVFFHGSDALDLEANMFPSWPVNAGTYRVNRFRADLE